MSTKIYASQEYVEEKLSNISGEGSGGTQADWNENNETSAPEENNSGHFKGKSK